jgi:transcriptional regulator with XRE-family HTH domain
MTTKSRPADLGEARARASISRLVTDAKQARLGAGLSQASVARAMRISPSQYSRIERGFSPDLSIRTASRLCAVLGLDLSVRTFPTGDPIRDAAQIALLDRLRSRCHPSLRWATEVPMSIPGDPTVAAATWTAGVEAETVLADIQALDRRLALKERDGGKDRTLLVISDTRRNRSILRSAGDVLRVRFPVWSGVALAELARGTDPGGNALIVL